MDNSLENIDALLRQGLSASRQGSYHRRAPAPRAAPLLEKSRRELRSWIDQNGETMESLRLLALAEEALLNYESAASILDKVIRLSPKPHRKDLKRLMACREASQLWREVNISPEELVRLGLFLKDKLLDTAPERSFRWTEAWLDENKPSGKNKIIASLQKLGYFSDYQVLHNLVAG